MRKNEAFYPRVVKMWSSWCKFFPYAGCPRSTSTLNVIEKFQQKNKSEIKFNGTKNDFLITNPQHL
jgi:hypothetical protein